MPVQPADPGTGVGTGDGEPLFDAWTKYNFSIAFLDSERVTDAARISVLEDGGFTLSGLDDVVLTSLASDDVLVASGSNFINKTLSDAGIAAEIHDHAGT